MKYPKLIETLTRTPLGITPGAVESYLDLLHQHATMDAAAFRAAREGRDMCGDKVELEQMTIDGRLAMIPVNGPLGIRLGSFEKGAGAVDYLDIMADLKAANEDPRVESIILMFDSPGGMFSGLPETARAIEQSRKPVYSYVPAGAQCCSAALWLAAPTEGIFCASSAQLGSIGVYCAYHDFSAMAEQRGIKVKVFSSGKYKGMGVPGTSLTADQEAFLQDNVMKLAEEFYDHVNTHLPGVPADAMQGQSFCGKEAVDLNLAMEVMDDFEELKRFLS